ncbi:MAG TPA: endonuclease III [Methanomassiliicoccales archaeon]|jgi:endonuclease-3|nr:endonuclease III [Euryarchaeota archaeon]HOO04111.1 endonuclease III [Methanomassiliicoccales archaeon]HQM66208.1 endonuclease III [Methanomassiliicoccales archaeon]HRU11959.1 endonuclease III [Methanomassiliicoccales archaeon]
MDLRWLLRSMQGAVKGTAFPGLIDEEDPWWEKDPFHVLVATVLSQRTRDLNTSRASSELFRRFNTPEAMAAADLAELEALVRPVGFHRAKAKAIKEIARLVVENGGVPKDIDRLMEWPMVGRKTANCVLAYAFKEPAICVDTHVHRISNRLGLVTCATPEGTEMALRRLFPRALWCEINGTMVRFGQKVCLPRNPKCGLCPVKDVCAFYKRKG